INGRPASAAQLAEIGERLLEIHGQHEHQALLDRGQQLVLLDAYGQHQDLLRPVQQQAEHWQALNRRLAEIERQGDVSERVAWL
ncbi:DNA repair protein RecN, partial [Enterococcus casseliflavus]